MITYLQVENLSKAFGDNVLFENISFSILKDSKTALIAKNGTGKSTLLNIIAKIEPQDQGQIVFKNDIKVGYLAQSPNLDDNLTVRQQIFKATNLKAEIIVNYEKALEEDNKKDIEKYQNLMDAHNAWQYESDMKQILGKLKINNLDQKIGTLSGGQKKRIALADALIEQPDLLILDEPTNHLDTQMIEWLEYYLKNTSTTLLMVTHDRYFLDNVCDFIIEMDDNKIYNYQGNYSYYLKKREERIELFQAGIAKAENLLRKESDWISRMPKARGGKAKYRIDNFYKLKEFASQKLDTSKVEINQGLSRRLGNKILEIKNISKSYDDKQLIKDFSYSFLKNDKIGITGFNGCGKSTLLNIIMGNIKPDSGSVEFGTTVFPAYYRQDGIKYKEEDRVIDIIKEIAEVIVMGDGRKVSASQFLEYFLFPPKLQYAPVAKLSGGERRRLYLMTVLMKNPNFLILDEPTNDLDIITLNVLEEYLLNFQGCLLIVSHDRYFLDKVVDRLFVFEGNGKVKDFPGNYTVYLTEKEEEQQKQQPEKQSVAPQQTQTEKKKKQFTYKLQQEYNLLTKEIEELEKEKKDLEEKLSGKETDLKKITEYSNRIQEVNNLLEEKEMRWLELEEIKEND